MENAINQCKDYIKSWYNKKVIVKEGDLLMESQKEKVSNKLLFKMQRIVQAASAVNWSYPINIEKVIICILLWRIIN